MAGFEIGKQETKRTQYDGCQESHDIMFSADIDNQKTPSVERIDRRESTFALNQRGVA